MVFNFHFYYDEYDCFNIIRLGYSNDVMFLYYHIYYNIHSYLQYS